MPSERVEPRTVGELLDYQADRRGAAAFLIVPPTDRTLTFAGLRGEARRIAGGLAGLGLAPGDPVAYLLDNGLFSVALFLGAQYGGFVPVPLAPHGGPAQVTAALVHSEARLLLVAPEHESLIAGETADTAFLFVPSESIFADLHEHFEDVVQRALKARVVIVSPSILMLSIQVVQALLRDVRMREEAHKIQKEVRELLLDVGRLDERVRKLQQHFQQASNDIGDIVTSSQKVARRGERIEAMDFEERPEPQRLAGE